MIKLSDRLNSVEESVTLAINAQVKKLSQDGKKIYNLSVGEPVMATPPYIQDFVATKLDQNHYTAAAGMPELRARIAEHTNSFYRVNWISEENIVVVAGGKPGIFLPLLALLNPGDEVILPTPAWVSHKYIIELAGGKSIEVPLNNDFDLDLAAITKNISKKTKGILINSPSNPASTMYSSQSLKRLSKVVNEHNLFVLSDDIYVKLIYDESFEPITNFGFKNLIISNGFSKSQALTGWRIGYVIAEKQIIDAIIKLQSHLLGNVSSLSQFAALAALEQNDKPPMLDDLKANRKIALEIVSTIPKVTCPTPAGAFYILLNIKNITDDSLSWSQKLLEKKGVAVVPGDDFSAKGFVRISFACDEITLKEGLQKIKEFIEESL